jgi:hypothetical protein
MTSYVASSYYNPLLELLVGVSTFIGLWSVGRLALVAVRLRLPTPWGRVAAPLVGIQILSLIVQLLAMSSTATPLTLRLLWFAAVFVGAADTLNIRREAVSWYRQLQRQSLLSSPFLAVILIAAVVNLVIAIAPSSKIDELYYHMLVPSRIVQEGSLHFYLMPWQSAILPQMTFQIAAAPVHAIGYPDAMNVVSWALSALLLWFAWQLINENACFPHWTAIWVGSLIVGLYTSVWHVTGGAHAFGDLAICAAVGLFCKRESLLKVITPLEFAAASSIFALSAATTKISLLPLSLALLFFSLLG